MTLVLAVYLLGLLFYRDDGRIWLESTTLGLQLIAVGPAGIAGIEHTGSGDAGAAFLTLLLALATAYLGFETRRVAKETRRLGETTQTEIDLLTKQTSALLRSADAQEKLLLQTQTSNRAEVEPLLTWEIENLDKDDEGPERRTWVSVKATNIGGAAVMGIAKVDGPAEITHEQDDKLVPPAGEYRATLRFGPFVFGRPFDSAATLIQSFRPRGATEFAETNAVISVAGRGQFFNDWTATVMTADSEESREAVPAFLERHRARYRA